MQLLRNFQHGSENNHIFKVAFIEGTRLVSGGRDGAARLYNCQSGSLVEKLEHGNCKPHAHSAVLPVLILHFMQLMSSCRLWQ